LFITDLIHSADTLAVELFHLPMCLIAVARETRKIPQLRVNRIGRFTAASGQTFSAKIAN